MKLAKAMIRNFRAIRELDLDLHERLTVLVGENAAGKTCLLDAIAFGLRPVATRAGGMPDYPSAPPDAAPTGPVAGRRSDIRRVGGVWAPYAGVRLKDTDGLAWAFRQRRDSTASTKEIATREFPIVLDRAFATAVDEAIAQRLTRNDAPLPFAAYYGTERGVISDRAPKLRPPPDDYPWAEAYRGALNAPAHFASLFTWFEAAEAEELRRRRDEDPAWTHPHLTAVRQAVEAVIPGASRLRVSGSRRLEVTVREADGHEELLALSELSGGYRTLLALVADLARRMAQANPSEGTSSEAVVLIDEVDLHLHPRWQQTVLDSLLRAFPRAQFIVTTHSEQVIASVRPENVVRLDRSPDGVQASRPSSTFGATPDRIASDVFGVPHLRPVEVEDTLRAYWARITAGEGESDEARALRARLDDWFRNEDPELIRADAEIERRKMLARLRPGGR